MSAGDTQFLLQKEKLTINHVSSPKIGEKKEESLTQVHRDLFNYFFNDTKQQSIIIFTVK